LCRRPPFGPDFHQHGARGYVKPPNRGRELELDFALNQPTAIGEGPRPGLNLILNTGQRTRSHIHRSPHLILAESSTAKASFEHVTEMGRTEQIKRGSDHACPTILFNGSWVSARYIIPTMASRFDTRRNNQKQPEASEDVPGHGGLWLLARSKACRLSVTAGRSREHRSSHYNSTRIVI
jgi:hypothetical protein